MEENKIKYEYIHFIEIEQKPKTKVYSCRNNRSGEELGLVKWFPSWRQYCFYPVSDIILSKGCLKDIQNFIEQL